MESAEIVIKILQKGDKVLNTWFNNDCLYISVLSKNEEVCIWTVVKDEKGAPRLQQSPVFKITHGNYVIETKMQGADGTNFKAISF